ncbi:Gfo/Idh/MocA family protein [Acidimangrovimonas pyrenivorans]|uniref:Gfo/Idh/MocA family protein n=1 Tax=Acidimangrovimonas pyrenivorans TaxID=2030798 RepID=A0ABV7AHT7_9RHOB
MSPAPGTVAVIGAGSIGKRHAGNLERLGAEVRLIPYREFSAETLRRIPGLGAVVIATATQIRLDLIAQCAELGLPFYAEKPLAWTPAQAEAIHAAAAPVAERSMVGFMMRYHPAVLDLARRDLSQVYSFSFEIGHDVRQWRPNWRFGDSYAALPEGGGVLLDLCHELDMALALFPGLELGRCDSLGHAEYPGVDFATTAQLAAPGGPMGQVEMDYLSPVSTRRAVLRGLDARVEIDFLRPVVVESRPGAGPVETPYGFDRNDMFLDAMRDFLALARGAAPSDNPLLPRFDRMRRSTALIAEAWSSRQIGGTVAIDMG